MLNESALNILCDPDTHESLIQQGDALVNPKSGKRFPVRDGQPCFVEEAAGVNRKYQSLYDWIAPFYDVGEHAYFWLTRKESYRVFLRNSLEIPAKARVLEVSVGTGANLPYLPAEVEFYGLDLSWGMLKRCRRNLRRWEREAFLCQGEGERLPFRDASFDVVFHVGGINFFDDRVRAIREMVRVARPGTRIVIADETERAVRTIYERMPFVRRFFKSRETEVRIPTELIPTEMREVRAETVFDGLVYVLSFRTPATAGLQASGFHGS
jgi:ubiquinone/menaquinone biosynthesis C-methylase UbiE